MREKIIEILNEICPGNDFENETAINDLTPENFNSVDAIVELIENAQD